MLKIQKVKYLSESKTSLSNIKYKRESCCLVRSGLAKICLVAFQNTFSFFFVEGRKI